MIVSISGEGADTGSILLSPIGMPVAGRMPASDICSQIIPFSGGAASAAFAAARLGAAAGR
jgi:hypothetical protein